MANDLITTPPATPVPTFQIEPGKTINETLVECQVPTTIWHQIVVTLNGIEVEQIQWGIRELVDSDTLTIFVVPLGGDKSVLRIVAIIGVAVLAAYTGGAAASLFAEGSFAALAAQAVVTVGVTMVGTLAINALIPPPKAVGPTETSVGNNYYLTGQTNRARFYEIVPIVYGSHKMIANLATAVDVFNHGPVSTFSAVYDFGLGGCVLSDVRAGDTDLDVLNGAWRPLTRVPQFIDVNDPGQGFEPIELEAVTFPVKYTELSIGLTEAYDPEITEPQPGAEGITTTSPTAKTAVMEISCPQGLFWYDDDAVARPYTVDFTLHWRRTGDTEWLVPPVGTKGYGGNGTVSFFSEIPDVPPPPEVERSELTANFWRLVDTQTPDNDEIVAPAWVVDDPDVTPTALVVFGAPVFIPPSEEGWLTAFHAVLINDTSPKYVVDEQLAKIKNPPDNPKGWPVDLVSGAMIISQDLTLGYIFGFEIEFAPGYGGEEGKQRWGIYIDDGKLLSIEDDMESAFRALTTNSYTENWFVNMNLTEQPGEPPVIVDDPEDVERYIGPNDPSNNYTYVAVTEKKYFQDPDPTNWATDGSNFDAWLYGVNKTLPIKDLSTYMGEFREAGAEWSVGSFQYRQAFHAFLNSGVKAFVQVPEMVSRSLARSGGQVKSTQGENFFIPIIEPDWDGPAHLEPDVINYGFSLRGYSTQPAIVSIVMPLPSPGQYDIRIRRHTPESLDPATSDYCIWNKIVSRGVTTEDNPYSVLNMKKQHTLLELQFDANDNVQGNVQQISAIAHSELRAYSMTTGWQTPAPSANPAWVVLDLLTGYSIQNHREVPTSYLDDVGWVSDAQIDMQSFVDLAELCDERVEYYETDGQAASRPRYQCNLIMATDSPIIETAQSILSMCRAQLVLNQSGLYAIMIDAEQTVPRQLFTPQNSWNFSGSRVFTEVPHAFKVNFTAPELGYNIASTTVYQPGYGPVDDVGITAAEMIETIDTYGITHWHQASQWGMYMLAQAVVRGEVFTLNVSAENLVVTRGDMVHIQHDVPLLGGTACIIAKDDSGYRVEVDQILGSFPEPWGYTHRRFDGTIATGNVDHIAEGENWFTIPDPGINSYQGEMIVVGTKKDSGTVTDAYLITQIRPGPDLTAEITMVKYDTAVYRTDWGSFPIWGPSFGEPPGEDTSLYISRTEGWAGIKHVNRQPVSYSQLLWFLSPEDLQESCAHFLIGFVKDGGGEPVLIATVDGDVRFWRHEYEPDNQNFGRGTYIITPVSNLGFKGGTGSVYVGKVTDTTPPHTPTNFVSSFDINSTTTLQWDFNIDDDIEEYQVWSGPDDSTQTTFLSAIPHDTNQYVLLGNPETHYFVRARDTSGNVSGFAHAFSLHPTPSGDMNLAVNINGIQSELTWTPLEGQQIDYYTLYYNSDGGALDPTAPGTETLGTAARASSSFAIQPRLGSYFIIATNIYGLPSDFEKALAEGGAELRDGLFWDGDSWELDRRTRLDVTGYVEGAFYQRGDEVTNGSQISEALVDGADEDPFVHPIGEQVKVFDGTLDDFHFTDVRYVLMGNRVHQQQSAFVVGYELQVHEGQTYRTFIVVDPDGTPIIHEIDNYVAETTAIITRPSSPILTLAGSSYDILVATRETAAAPVTFDSPWNYTTPQQFVAPDSGECVHANTETTVLAIHKTDNNGVADASKPPAEQLASLVTGDTITTHGSTWTITAVADDGAYFSFSIAPALQTSPDGVAVFTFEKTVVTDIVAGADIGWWSTAPYNGIGLYTEDGTWDDLIEDQNFYAIQPIYQQAYVPTQWHVKVISGGAIGGVSSFEPEIFTGVGSQGYVPDPVQNNEMTLFDDAVWYPVYNKDQVDVIVDGLVEEAPQDGITYGRDNHAWEAVYNRTEVDDLTKWDIEHNDRTCVWGERIRFDTPESTAYMPPPDQDVTGAEKLPDLVIWNDARVQDEVVHLVPATGTYFTFDGKDWEVDEVIDLSPGEIARISTRVNGVSYALAVEALSKFDGAGTFGFVSNPDGLEQGRYLSDDGTWQALTVIPAGGIRFEYLYDITNVVGDPGDGYGSINTTDPALATILSMSDTTVHGNSTRIWAEQLREGDFIGFVDEVDGFSYYYRVTGNSVDHTTWHEVPIENYYTEPGEIIPDQSPMFLAMIGDPKSRMPIGGAENEVLAKASGDDYVTYWMDVSEHLTDVDIPQDGWTYGRYWNGTSFDWNTGHTDPVSFFGDVSIGVLTANFGDLEISRESDNAIIALRSTGGGADFRIYAVTNNECRISAIGASDYMTMYTANMERLRVSSDGNVGIGTTNPNQKLQVLGANAGVQISNDVLNQANSAHLDFTETVAPIGNAAGYGYRIQHDGAANSLNIQEGNQTNISTYLTILRGGNVGIGTTIPDSKQVVSVTALTKSWTPSSTTAARFERGGNVGITIACPNTSLGTLRFGDSEDEDVGRITYDHVGDSMSFSTVAAERLRISADGKVGIGVTNPQRALHVKHAEAAPLRIETTNAAGCRVEFVDPSTVDVPRLEAIADDLRFVNSNNVTARMLSSGKLIVWGNEGTTLANERFYVNGNVNLGSGFNYYINGIPISTFIDAPADGNLYARKDAAWAEIDATGGGTISDLTSVPIASQVTIENTGGDNAIILGATPSLAGVMTADDKTKLDGIADNANNYDHPDFTVQSVTMNGATVPQYFNSNGEGHVTGFTTRTMTADDLDAYTKSETDAAIAASGGGVQTASTTPVFVGASGGSTSGTIHFQYDSTGFVSVTGRISWSTAPTGTGQVRISLGGAVNCTLSSGFGFSGSNAENQANAANGMQCEIRSGGNDVYVWGYNENGVRAITDYNDLNANGFIDLNFNYWAG